MYYPDLNEFLKLTKQGNVIPVYKEINADLDTPVSAFLKIGESEYAFLLESVEEQENVGRYSFLGSNPALVFRSKGKSIQLIAPQKKEIRRFITKTDPLDEIKKLMQGFKPVTIKGLPRFCGGLVGYFGYDIVRFFENIPDKNEDALKLSDAVFLLTDTILVFDHINHTIKIVTNIILPKDKAKLTDAQKSKFYREGLEKIEAIQKKLDSCVNDKKQQGKPIRKMKISSN
ncbi:MAG: anthranilate synthase component I, partial [Candidatus Omnitrophica bacterium]|nr:anthranilate synthase component I [Candidatus Omnitrophota bacterium]